MGSGPVEISTHAEAEEVSVNQFDPVTIVTVMTSVNPQLSSFTLRIITWIPSVIGACIYEPLAVDGNMPPLRPVPVRVEPSSSKSHLEARQSQPESVVVALILAGECLAIEFVGNLLNYTYYSAYVCREVIFNR